MYVFDSFSRYRILVLDRNALALYLLSFVLGMTAGEEGRWLELAARRWSPWLVENVNGPPLHHTLPLVCAFALGSGTPPAS